MRPLQFLQNEKNRFDRYHIACSIIITDIDRLKQINDNYGHEIGDKVLVEIADIFRNRLRNMDICGRWGGEEFLIICQNTGHDNAREMVESLRADIGNHLFPTASHVTASLGVSTINDNEEIERAVKRADDALYHAKESGRNRVACQYANML